MPIDFTCSGCAKQLRVSDESVGKDARCPECGSINRVPSTVGASFTHLGSSSPPEKKDWLFNEAGGAPASSNPFGAGPVNPYTAPQAASYQPDYGQYATGPIRPTVVSVEPILNYSWQIWQANLGLLVGTTFVAALINWAISKGVDVAVQSMLQNDFGVAMSIAVIGNIIGYVVQIYLGIGEAQIALKLARHERAEFGDLFGGGSLLLPVLLTAILFALAILAGLVLFIIPAIFVALIWWPTSYLLIEKKADIIESFTVAYNITRNNWGTGFLLALLSIAIIIVGLLALCVGVLFAAPLVGMLWAVAYLMMSGQLSSFPNSQYSAYGKP